MRKSLILYIVMALTAVMLAGSAVADVTVTSSFGENNPTFGDDEQKASNPNLDDDDDDYDVYDSATVTLHNNGSEEVVINGYSIVPKLGLSKDDLNITIASDFTISADNSASVTIRARIPEELDAVDDNLEPVAFNVASLHFASDSTEVASMEVYMQRENKLEIDEVVVNVNDGESTFTIKDSDDNVDEIKPGDRIEIEVIASNEYDENDDVEIDADDGEWEISGDIDEEESLDFGEINPEDTESLSESFKIDDDVDDDEYDFKIKVEGTDEHGARHGQKIETEFEVEKEDHEIIIEDITSMPSTVECGELFTVRVEVKNIGKRDEDEAAIKLRSSDLDIDEIIGPFNLDEGDSSIKTFNFRIPEDAESGSKLFTVIAAYNMGGETDRDTFTANVQCATEEEEESEELEEEEEDNTTPTVPPAVVGGTATAEPTSDSNPVVPMPITTVGAPKESGFRASSVYVLLLVLAIVIVVMAGAFLIAKMLIVK